MVKYRSGDVQEWNVRTVEKTSKSLFIEPLITMTTFGDHYFQQQCMYGCLAYIFSIAFCCSVHIGIISQIQFLFGICLYRNIVPDS